MLKIHTLIADYANPAHAEDLVRLMCEYALHPMGGGKALSEDTKNHLPGALVKVSGAFSVLAYRGTGAVGLANCFMGFSTFKCKALVNIHDIIVSHTARGQGVGTHMLNHIETVAQQRQCCKITLEVLEDNTAAQNAYRKFGFDGYQLNSETGKALFWEKPLLYSE